MEVTGNAEMLATIAMGLMALGGILSFISGIWLLVLAFQKSMLWGVVCFFIPGATFVFAIMHWGSSAQEALMLQIVSVLFIGVAMFYLVSLGEMMPVPATNGF